MRRSFREAPRCTLFYKVCPYEGCDGKIFGHVWTEQNGDDTRSQYQICDTCGRPVVWIYEPHPRGGGLTFFPLDNPE